MTSYLGEGGWVVGFTSRPTQEQCHRPLAKHLQHLQNLEIRTTEKQISPAHSSAFFFLKILSDLHTKTLSVLV